MKKNILTASFATIATLLFTASCTERDQFEILDRQDGTFTGVIEQVDTKTTLSDKFTVEWQSGDIISINGQRYSASPQNPASTALFKAVKEEASPIDGKYTAIYPADLYNARKGQLEFPDTIAYVKGQLNTPMYAESTNDKLSFKNLCGVLHLSLSSSETATVKAITVTAFESICGPFKVSMDENDNISVEFDGKGKSVTLDCGQGIKLSAGPNEFYIPLPEGTYSPGMSVAVEDGNNNIFLQTTKKEVEIVRNTVYDFDWQVAYAPKLEAEYNNVYKQMALLVGSKQPGKEYNPYRVLFNMCGDDVCAADAYANGYGFIAQLNDFTYTADNEVIYNCYTNLYKAIDVCNKFIGGYYNEAEKKLDSEKIAKLDSAKVFKYVDEVRTLRAWLHFTLAEGWGNPPIVDTYPAPEDLTNVEQKKVFNWIEEEIKSILKDAALDERNGKSDAAGAAKVTKAFARALLGKAFLFDEEPDSAIVYLKPVVESGNYDLVPGENFFDLFHREGNGCPEKIFELDMSKVTDYAYAGTETKLWACNDKCFVAAPWKAGQASESAWGLGLNVDYAKDFFEYDGDSFRRTAVFLTSDEVFFDETLTSYGIWEQDPGIAVKAKSPQIGVKSEGLYGQCDKLPRKLIVKNSDAPSGSNMTNFTVMRLGEAYLLYAEACSLSGQTSEGLKYLNRVQERSGSGKISSLDLTSLKEEKKFELWMEGCRWADIVRWGPDIEITKLMTKATSQVCTAQDKYTLSGGEDAHELTYTNELRQVNFNVEKHKYFPYPAEVLKRNSKLVQNPGWSN